MRYWLARASFALFALAFALAYDAYRLAQLHPANRWPIRLRFTGAFLAFILAIMGTRFRHQPPNGPQEPNPPSNF